jgi:HK97 family phage major capsid protein
MSDIVEIVQKGLHATEQKFERKIQELQAEITDLSQKSAGYRSVPTGGASGGAGGGSLLNKFATLEQVRAFAGDRSIKNANVKLGALNVLTKSGIVVGDLASSSNDLFNTQPNRSPTIGENAQRRLSLLTELQRIPVTSNAFEFNQLDSYVAAANYQGQEGALKPQQSMPTELKTAPIATIAAWTRFSEQVLADNPALQVQANGLLRYGVLAKAQAEMIAGNDQIVGLQELATSYIAASDAPMADAIGAAQTALDIQGWNGTHVVMHPTDWHAIRAEREENGGAYIANGWANPNRPTIWGMSVITDPAVDLGKPLVFDATQCAILDREDARVELGRSGDDFIRNQVVMLAEMRVGLVVFSPSAVLQVVVPT